MSSPSRRPEIRRRRTRKIKIDKMRKVYAKGSEAEKTKVLGKLYKMTPQVTKTEFEAVNAVKFA